MPFGDQPRKGMAPGVTALEEKDSFCVLRSRMPRPLSANETC
jgi:hypothetical protein